MKALTVTPYGTDSHGNMVKAGTRDRGEATYSVNQTGKYRITNYVHELGLLRQPVAFDQRQVRYSEGRMESGLCRNL